MAILRLDGQSVHDWRKVLHDGPNNFQRHKANSVQLSRRIEVYFLLEVALGRYTDGVAKGSLDLALVLMS